MTVTSTIGQGESVHRNVRGRGQKVHADIAVTGLVLARELAVDGVVSLDEECGPATFVQTEEGSVVVAGLDRGVFLLNIPNVRVLHEPEG